MRRGKSAKQPAPPKGAPPREETASSTVRETPDVPDLRSPEAPGLKSPDSQQMARGRERSSSVESGGTALSGAVTASSKLTKDTAGSQRAPAGGLNRLRGAVGKAARGKSPGESKLNLAAVLNNARDKERITREQDEVRAQEEEDRRRRWEAEMEKMKQQALRIAQLERQVNDLSGKLQNIQLRHEAEMADKRQEIIEVTARVDELKELLKQKDHTIADQEQAILALRTGINMSRVQLAYNFVAQYSNIDVVVQPEEIFTTLQRSVADSPMGAVRLPGASPHRRRRRSSAPFICPSKGKVHLTIEKPTRPGEWRNQKVRLVRLIAGMSRCTPEQLQLHEKQIPGDETHSVVEFAMRTGELAGATMSLLKERAQWDEDLKKEVLEGGIMVDSFACWRPEPHLNSLTPAGRELLRLNQELCEVELEEGAKKQRAGPVETRWERERREQSERDRAFELARTAALRPVRWDDLPAHDRLFPILPGA